MLGGCPYVHHDVTHTRFCLKIFEISSRSRPMGSRPTSITPRFFLKNHWKLCLFAHTTFKSNWNLFPVLISRLEIQPFIHNIHLKFSIDLDPWLLDPHHPPIFTQKLLKTEPSRLYDLQITLKSVDISIFGLKSWPNTGIFEFQILKWAKNQDGGHDIFFLVLQHPRHEISRTSHFQTFQGENVMFLWDYDVITQGFPAKNGETPSKLRFWLISSRNVHADNQTQCNNTFFVQNFD